METSISQKEDAFLTDAYGIVLDEKASELTKGNGGLVTETNMYESQP